MQLLRRLGLSGSTNFTNSTGRPTPAARASVAMRLRRLLANALATTALASMAVAPAAAQTKTATKVSPDLLQASRSLNTGPGAGAIFTRQSILPVHNGMVLIDAVATDDARALKSRLETLGLRKGATYGAITSGWLPLDKVGELERVPGLRSVRPSYRQTAVGSVTSQADAAMRTDDVRDILGLDGTGLKVGVLSDTIAQLGSGGGLASDVASGDLPPGIEILEDFAAGGIDEGRAMAQLIYDSAPGVDLSFHTAFGGIAGFALGIEELAGCPPGSDAACGTSPGGASAVPADVIVDDVIYFSEPMFQDGAVAQAVDTVVASGVPYFSSAGNNGRRSYEAVFEPGPTIATNAVVSCGPPFSPPQLFGGVAHDFDSGPGVDIYQEVTLNPGEGAEGPYVFQWDQPHASVTGGPGSASDYDIYMVLTDAGTTGFPAPCLVDGGNYVNVGNDPFEILNGFFLNSSAPSPVKVAFLIVQFSDPGPDATYLKYVGFGGKAPDEYDTQSGTSYGHANAAGAEAVGAAYYGDTPEFGVSPPNIEFFSSAGGVPILLNIDGTRKVEPEVRLKPGITAPDGTNNTFFGYDFDGDTFPNFFGTSAAAPHAAAVAALQLQANPALPATAVYEAQRLSAIDMDDPATGGFDAGFDFGTGFGLVDAFEAVSLVQADSDADGVIDAMDNCLAVANGPGNAATAGPAQNDADGDGIGNVCDADLNNDCIVNTIDLGIFKNVFFSPNANADFNGDGVVNPVDLGILKSGFFMAPGPSANECIPFDGVLVETGDPAFVNQSIGTLLNGTSDAFPEFSDPFLDFTTAPDLSAAQQALGDWLVQPVPDLGAPGWSGTQEPAPTNWQVNTEIALVYVFETGGITNLVAEFGVDNGIFVWLDGVFIGGALRPGGVVLGEHTFNLGDLDAGTHYLQVLLEDHGLTNGYEVRITADAVLP